MSWLSVVALVWLVVAAFALQAHQRGSARSAQRWTTRLYAVTLVPLTALVIGAALVALQLPSIDAGDQAALDGAVAAARPHAQWLAVATNLVVVDMVLRRRDAVTRRREGSGRHTGSGGIHLWGYSERPSVTRLKAPWIP